MDVTIRRAVPADAEALTALANLLEAAGFATVAAFRRTLESDWPAGTERLVAETGGEVAGFALSVLHAGTWTTAPVCYLEDLFVAPEHRGRGIGEALVRDLVGLATTNGWSRIYWHTQAGNKKARSVYDRFTKADDFVRYRLFL